jgi:APA family basic amino acid/polyamine antiporter
MTKLPIFPTWTAMVVWMLIGFVIYFGYSIKHSKVQKLPLDANGH